MTKDDRGTYYCVAENGVGRGVRRNIAVEVMSAPVVTTSNSKVEQSLQYDTVLDCHVEAYPPPAIVWILNGVILSNNQRYTYTYLKMFSYDQLRFDLYCLLLLVLEYHILLLPMKSRILPYVLLRSKHVNMVIISAKHLMSWELLKLLFIFMVNFLLRYNKKHNLFFICFI